MAIGRKLPGLAGLTAAVYALVLRPGMDRWGATDEEVQDTYPGRELIPDGVRSPGGETTGDHGALRQRNRMPRLLVAAGY